MFNPAVIYGLDIPFVFDPVPVVINGYKFPVGASVDVTGGKKIVKTEIPGLKGTVKQFAGMDDYQISINIVSNHLNHLTAKLELKKIIALWEKTDGPLAIICPKTAMYGIDRVVFESLSHPQIAGFPGMEILTLGFVSDTLYDIELLDVPKGSPETYLKVLEAPV